MAIKGLIGSLFIDMALNSARFKNDIAKSNRELNKFKNKSVRSLKALKRSFSNVGKGVRRLHGALIGIAAAGGIGLLIKRSIEAGDALAKTADKLGLTTEALAGLQHAGELTGIAVNTTNMAIQRMVRRLAEAAQGMGEAQGALKELGLDAQELADLTPDEAFIKIAGAMKKVRSEADKVRLSFKLFDSEGVALKNTLALGEAGLRAAAVEARELGIAISRVDAAKLEDANDAILKMKQSFSGLVTQLAIKLAPIIKEVTDLMTLFAKDLRKQNAEATESVKEQVVVYQMLADGSVRLGVIRKQIHEEFKAMNLRETGEMLDNHFEAKQARIDAATEAVELSKWQTNQFAGGFHKTAQEWGKNQRLMAEAGASTASALQSSFSNNFFNVFMGETKNSGDFFKATVHSMRSAFLSAVSAMIAKYLILKAVMFATGGTGIVASFFHEGGEVGASSAPKRKVSASAFAGAPRMHGGGLASDEVPAILQKGERVIPKDETGGVMRIEIPVIIGEREIARVIWNGTRRGTIRVHPDSLYDPASA